METSVILKKAVDLASAHVNELDANQWKHWPYDLIFAKPLFWQALGKAMGWKEIHDSRCNGDGKYSKTGVKDRCSCVPKQQWFYQWHRFIDHLASGGDAESFFTNLLKP